MKGAWAPSLPPSCTATARPTAAPATGCARSGTLESKETPIATRSAATAARCAGSAMTATPAPHGSAEARSISLPKRAVRRFGRPHPRPHDAGHGQRATLKTAEENGGSSEFIRCGSAQPGSPEPSAMYSKGSTISASESQVFFVSSCSLSRASCVSILPRRVSSPGETIELGSAMISGAFSISPAMNFSCSVCSV
jgi:hypothetical protein